MRLGGLFVNFLFVSGLFADGLFAGSRFVRAGLARPRKPAPKQQPAGGGTHVARFRSTVIWFVLQLESMARGHGRGLTRQPVEAFFGRQYPAGISMSTNRRRVPSPSPSLGLGLGLWFVMLLAILSPPVAAMQIEFAGRSVKRDILVLYDRRQEGPPIETRVHRFAEMPLNHLGYMLTYVDVNQPLPDPGALQKYRGLMTWLNEPLKQPERIAAWLERATSGGLRYVVFGKVAPPASATRVPAIGRILARLGLADSGGYVNLTYKARIAKADPKYIGFERPVDKVIPEFPVIVAASDRLRVHGAIKVKINGVDTTAIVVASNRNGGYAAQNFTFYHEKNTDRIRWTLNPFAFFKSAFGDERFPIPDTTTLDGKRIYFSHIDGDGWNNVSRIEKYRRKEIFSAEVIEREAIEPYPDLPVSVALLAGDLDLGLGGNPKGAAIARRLYALPQVEVASHTYTHPYDWQFFKHYDRRRELEMIDRYQRPDAPLRKRFTAAMLRLANKRVPADRFNKYIAGSDDLPRAYLKEPFHLQHEIGDALAVLRRLAPAGKKPALYQWSGDTTPFPAAIAATRRAGVRNINGGDSRFDWEFPSVVYVAPISRVTGGERQIYAVNSNENTYTNDWTGPYFGLFMLQHTLNNTDRPRRLKAFNLYYHMYSGERAAALAAVKHFLNLARKSDVIPIKASHYAAIADDYFNVKIEQIEANSWAVLNRGAMQTMRFDDAMGLRVNYSRSIGVLGTTRHEGSLYVALDEAVERAVIALQPATAGRNKASGERASGDSAVAAQGPAEAGQARSAGRPADIVKVVPVPAPGSQTPSAIQRRLRLVKSRWHLSHLVGDSCGLQVRAQGFGAGDMIWRAPPGRGFVIAAIRDGKLLWQDTRWTDKDGLLRLRIKRRAIAPLLLRFTCHE